MHILLIVSYLFSIWMIVDAFKRGAEHYWCLIIFFPLGEWVYFFLVKIHDYKGLKSESTIKCESCRHCATLYDDGVRCKAGGTPVFMTNTHVDYCTDYQKST